MDDRAVDGPTECVAIFLDADSPVEFHGLENMLK